MMNTNTRYSRRNLLRTGTGAGIATVLGLAFSTPGIRQALAQAGDTELVCNANGVRIRKDPGLSGTVIGSLSSGAVVNLIGDPVTRDGYTWLNISPQANRNLTGWAAAQFFGEPGGGGWAIGTDVVVATDSLNLRADPGLSGRVILSARNGTHAVTRTAALARDGYTWYGVTLDDGTKGYFAGEFLEEGTGGGGNDGWPAGTILSVADGPLNLRRSAGTGGGVIRTYVTGTQATVISGPTAANGYDWYKVEIAKDGNVGWFAGDFLEVARTEPTGDRLRVVDGPLRLRRDPGLNGAVLTTLSTGTIVVVADASSVRQDGYLWRYVRLESNRNVIGWIADGFTERIG
jgi:hypothetical protein